MPLFTLLSIAAVGAADPALLAPIDIKGPQPRVADWHLARGPKRATMALIAMLL